MSILIKGMEMPKTCFDCPLCEQTDFYASPYCRFSDDDDMMSINEIRSKRRDNCPLVPVPPHGRLIDADALEMERRAENAKEGWHDSIAVVFNGDPYYEAIYDCTEQLKELVNNAPTIIPAEEGE